jgi:hypothetical protein
MPDDDRLARAGGVVGCLARFSMRSPMRCNWPQTSGIICSPWPTSRRSLPRGSPVWQAVAPRLRQLLDTMTDVPAMVLNRRMDVLAWNRGAAGLMTDFGALLPAERNLIRLTFLDAAFRSLYADWPRAARDCVAVLRMEAGRNPHDPVLSALVGELSVHDADFRAWWASHQVRGPQQLTKTYQHPVVGSLVLDVQQFSVATHPDQQLVAFTAEPDSTSQEALGFLLQWSTTLTHDR